MIKAALGRQRRIGLRGFVMVVVTACLVIGCNDSAESTKKSEMDNYASVSPTWPEEYPTPAFNLDGTVTISCVGRTPRLELSTVDPIPAGARLTVEALQGDTHASPPQEFPLPEGAINFETDLSRNTGPPDAELLGVVITAVLPGVITESNAFTLDPSDARC
jgi:hypothetical protein